MGITAVLLAALAAPGLRGQIGPAPIRDPGAALAEALSAACRQDQTGFATHLTAANAAAFRALPEPQRIALLKRFVLLDDAGKPLLSTTAEGRTEVRCEAAGLVSDMRFGPAEVRENLAFVAAEVGELGEEGRPVRIGLVREAGDWKLLSVGLLLLDLPAISRQWEEADMDAREAGVIDSLHKIAEALGSYRRAYGKLPEALEQLGPASADGISPERAALLDASLAGGESAGYRFRYTIVPVAVEGDESDRDKAAGFQLAATPVEYGSAGRRSFYFDSMGMLRGADKHGAVATVDDPEIGQQRP